MNHDDDDLAADEDPIDELTPEEHLTFWGVPAGSALPAPESLLRDIEHIFDGNLYSYNAAQETGLYLSPIWEPGDRSVVVRACDLPLPFFAVYFDESEADFRAPETQQLLVDILAVLWLNIGQATRSFDDTLKLWLAPEAPVRSLREPYRAHHMLLSALMADWARKAHVQMNIPEYLMSIGFLEEFYNPIQHGPIATIEAAMNEKIEALWEEEDQWLQDEFSDD